MKLLFEIQIISIILCFSKCRDTNRKENEKSNFDLLNAIDYQYDHFIEPESVHFVEIVESRVTKEHEFANFNTPDVLQQKLIATDFTQSVDSPSWLYVILTVLTIFFSTIFFGFLLYICFNQYKRVKLLDEEKFNIHNKINIKVDKNNDKGNTTENVTVNGYTEKDKVSVNKIRESNVEEEDEIREVGTVCSFCKRISCEEHENRASKRYEIKKKYYNDAIGDEGPLITDITDEDAKKKLHAVCSRCKKITCKYHNVRAAERLRIKRLYFNQVKLDEALEEETEADTVNVNEYDLLKWIVPPQPITIPPSLKIEPPLKGLNDGQLLVEKQS